LPRACTEYHIWEFSEEDDRLTGARQLWLFSNANLSLAQGRRFTAIRQNDRTFYSLAFDPVEGKRMSEKNAVGRFKGICAVVEQGDLISGDGFLELASKNPRIQYVKRDALFRNVHWRGQSLGPAILRPKTSADNVIIFGHSDLRTSRLVSKLVKVTQGVTSIFGTNLEPIPDFAHSIPIGVTNNTLESHLHQILGDPTHFTTADSRGDFPRDFAPSILSNFTAANNNRVRTNLLKVLSGLPNSIKVRHSEPDFSGEGRVRFLVSCRTAGLVACPEGNGIDTHRLWETIYMGGVPVVTESRFMNSLFDKIPVVTLRRWEEMSDLNLLEQKWVQATSMRWDSRIVLQSFWNNRILETRSSSAWKTY